MGGVFKQPWDDVHHHLGGAIIWHFSSFIVEFDEWLWQKSVNSTGFRLHAFFGMLFWQLFVFSSGDVLFFPVDLGRSRTLLNGFLLFYWKELPKPFHSRESNLCFFPSFWNHKHYWGETSGFEDGGVEGWRGIRALFWKTIVFFCK